MQSRDLRGYQHKLLQFHDRQSNLLRLIIESQNEKQVREDLIPSSLWNVFSLKIALAACEYSLGKHFDLIRDSVIEAIELFTKTDNRYGEVGSTIHDLMSLVSLAILVDVDNRSWQKMTTKWQEMGEHGELISLLLQSKNPELRYKHSTFGDKRYESLLNLIKEDKEENLLAGLKVYLNKWHSRHRNFWFHDGHLEDGPAYIGYWSYEAAAVAKIKGLDLTHTKLGEYFPYSFFGLPEQPKKTGKTKKVDLPKAESVISYPNFSRLTFDLADVWVNKSIQRLDLFTKDGKLECAGTVYNGDKDGFEDFIQSRHSSLLARMPWYQLVGGSTSVSLPVGQANKQLMQGTWEGDKDLTSYWVYSLCFGKYYLGITFTFMAQEQTLHEPPIDDLLASIRFEERKR